MAICMARTAYMSGVDSSAKPTRYACLRLAAMTTTALAGALLLVAPNAVAADLDLLGVNTSLPAAPFATPMLSGADNVVNSNAVAATLTEGERAHQSIPVRSTRQQASSA